MHFLGCCQTVEPSLTPLFLSFFDSSLAAYKHADGKKIDGRRVLVDVERGRTVKGWRPRRLGCLFFISWRLILSFLPIFEPPFGCFSPKFITVLGSSLCIYLEVISGKSMMLVFVCIDTLILMGEWLV